jgi:hypothetical protein
MNKVSTVSGCEVGGNEFERLEDVQDLLLKDIAGMLVEQLHRMIDEGELISQNGIIVVIENEVSQ